MKQFYRLIAASFKPDEIEDMAFALHVEIVAGTASTMARNLYEAMRQRLRLDELFDEVQSRRPKLDLTPHFYELIAHNLEEKEMVDLCQQMGQDAAGQGLDASGLLGWDYDAYIRNTKAWALQEWLSAQDRFAELVAAMRELRPAMSFKAFGPDKGPDGREGGSGGQPTKPVSSPRPLAIDYQDFVIHIGRPREADGLYPVTVLDSPRGRIVDEPEWQAFPLDDPAFHAPIKYLSGLIARPDDVKALGDRLRQLLFPGRVWSLFERCLDDLDRRSGLRIRLQLDHQAGALSALPWEYSYYPERNLFLATRRTTPLVRYIERNYKVRSLAGERPRLLVAMASPKHRELALLNEAGEVDTIRDALDGLDTPLDWDLLTGATYDKLQKKLWAGYDVLHFVGHGLIGKTGQGALAFEDDAGNLDEIDYEELSVLLRDTGIKLVVLTACETAVPGEGDIFKGVAQSLVQAEIPAVIAMQFIVEYSVAQDFIGQFYHYLAAGEPLDRALAEARISAYRRDRISWGIPVLFMQSPDGVIWRPREQGR